MNYLMQRGKIRSQVINIPEGLPELLSDITREVLRCQPTTECLCQFIIDYCHSLIVARDKARLAKLIIDSALRTVDDVISDMCICDISKEKAEKMSQAMEECFKNFLAKRRCEKDKIVEIVKFNEIDILDELIQKCKFSSDELKKSRPVIEASYQKFVEAYMKAQENTEGTEALYQYFRDRELKRIEERIAKEAAIKIQSSFRGYIVRRSLFTDKPVEKPTEDILEPPDNIEQLDIAARKIQHFFRSHLNLLHQQTETVSEPVQDVCKPESEISLTVHKADSRMDSKAELEAHESHRDVEIEVHESHHDESEIQETTTENVAVNDEEKEDSKAEEHTATEAQDDA